MRLLRLPRRVLPLLCVLLGRRCVLPGMSSRGTGPALRVYRKRRPRSLARRRALRLSLDDDDLAGA